MKNKKLLTVLVALVMAVVVSLTATIAVLGAGNEVTVKTSENGSAVIDTLPGGLNDGDTLVVICDTENGAFVNTKDAPNLAGIKYVVGNVTVTAGLNLTMDTWVPDKSAVVTGFGIAVEVEDSIELPEDVANLFGTYSDYVIGVGATCFDANEDQFNDGMVNFDVAVTMPEGVDVAVYDADYNVVTSSYSAGVVSFEGELGEGYVIAPKMAAVVDGVGYLTLEEAIAVAEGSFDTPVVIISKGRYVLDTSSQVVVAFASSDCSFNVADGVLSYETEVTYEGSEYIAFALYQKDYLFASIADGINSPSYGATYANGALDVAFTVEDAADLADIITVDGLYEVIGAIAPLAVVGETIELDGYVVYNGSFNADAVQEFLFSKMLTLNELAGLTSKTITTFDIVITSGDTVVTVPTSITLDCTDDTFASIKENAATAAEYVVITTDNGVITVVADAVKLCKKALAESDEYSGLTTKEFREKLNALTVNELVEKLQASKLTDKYATAVDVVAKLVNKLASTKYAANLDVAVGVLDKDGDGVYTAAKSLTFTADSLVAKLQEKINTQYPEYAEYIDVEAMIGNVSISISFDATIKVFNMYTVTFVDENGNELYSETILEGEVPEFVGETPVKEGTETAVFEFAGWKDGETVYETLPELTADTVYTVAFEEIAIEGIDTAINAKCASVVFNGKMSVKFYVPKEALDAYENFYANVVITTVDGDVETQIEGTENGAYYQFVVYGIAAKQLNDNIAFEVVATKTVNGVSVTRNSEVKDYSVEQYAYNRLANANATDAEKTLLVDFLNYGAAAQKYFDYKADDLVNADLTDEQKAYGSATVPALESDFSYEGQETELVLFKGASLLFIDNIAVKFVINFNYYRGTTSDVHLVVECNGSETIVSGDELVANGSFYTYTYEGLAIKELRTPVTVTVVETATGKVLSGPLTYSAETYAYNKQSSTDAELVELLNNLMKFAVSAEAFL